MSTATAMSGLHAWLYIHPLIEQRRHHARADIAADLGVALDQVIHHTNVLWVTPEKESLKRSEVTRIMAELSLTAFDGQQTRWVVVDEAHKLTPEAANSLLKLLEEPPLGTQIILLSPAATLVMSTLRSRTGLKVLASSPLVPLATSEMTDQAKQFVDGSVAQRFGIIGQAHKQKQLEGLFTALMQQVYQQRDFPSLSWLQGYSQGRASRNTRLVLEAYAVQEWLV